MKLPAPFVYSSKIHKRKHAPAGYSNYPEYKPWLRDEFSFRCVYCLEREMWYPDRADSFSVDHLVAQSEDRSKALDYTNLVYSCTRCNSLKGRKQLFDPSQFPFGQHLKIEKDATFIALSVEGESFLHLFRLNEDPALAVRKNYLVILALKQDFPDEPRIHELFLQAFSYPEDLPNLVTLKPPGGNALERNKLDCFHALREKGILPSTY